MYPQRSLGSERRGARLCAEQTRKQHTQEQGVWGRLKLSSRGGVVPRGQFEKVVVMCQGPPQTDAAGWPAGVQEKVTCILTGSRSPEPGLWAPSQVPSAPPALAQLSRGTRCLQDGPILTT